MNISVKKVLIPFFIITAFFTADVFSSPPILRVEVGQHTAMINRMAVDKDAKILATASDDKTIRLWNLPEGTLYTTLRVPIGEQLVGALYAVAVSPDGKTVIASGQTVGADQQFSLYFFDVEKRVLKARIPDLPAEVNHLAYSKDGKYIAAALASGEGIRIWDSQTGDLLGGDGNYSGKRSTWLDFSESGNLATVSYDGYVRIYDNHFKLLKKAILTAQGEPYSISFSANGQLLAIGYSNLLQVDIADLDLNRVNSLPTEKLIATNTAIVTWQKNSNTALFASGDMKTKDNHFVIRHWQDVDSSSRSFKDIEVSDNTITDIISLVGNGDSEIDALFSSTEPSWGTLTKNKLISKNQAKLWDARTVELPNKTFSVSEDGLTIAFSQQDNSNKLTVFDITHRTLQTLDNDELLKTLSPPIKENQKFKITNPQRNVPTFNGKTLNLVKAERSLAWAIDPKSTYALFGTNYYLRMYDVHGKEIKKVPVAAEVYAVNVTANGKLAVAALGDGTIHWYSLSPGEELDELVTFFPYNNENRDWIVWTKEGFFGQSDGGGYRLAGYHLNKGENKRPEWIGFSQVFQTYYAPELIVPKLLRQEDAIRSRLTIIGNVEERFNNKEIPIIELVKYCPTTKVKTKGFIRTAAVFEAGKADLSIYDKFKFVLYRIYDWFKSLFYTENADEAVIQAELSKPSDSQNMDACPSIGMPQTKGYKIKQQNQISPSNENILTTTSLEYQLDKNTDSIDLSFIVKPRKGGIGKVAIYVNGIVRYSQAQRPSTLPDTDNSDLKINENLTLKEGRNEIYVKAFEKTDGANAESEKIVLFNPAVSRTAAVKETDKQKPRLFVFSVGIDKYKDPLDGLNYAVKDSRDFLDTVAENKSNIYSDVIKYQLKDDHATLQEIESTFSEIAEKISSDDTILVYLSGHGVIEGSKKYNKETYYFLPYDTDVNNFDETSLSHDNLERNIGKITKKANNVFVFVDSCHSGAVDLQGIQKISSSLEKAGQQVGNIFILAASAANQEALDSYRKENNTLSNNGLFADVVLRGLKGQGSYRNRKNQMIVKSSQLGDFVRDTVKEEAEIISYNQDVRFQNFKDGNDVTSFEITVNE